MKNEIIVLFLLIAFAIANLVFYFFTYKLNRNTVQLYGKCKAYKLLLGIYGSHMEAKCYLAVFNAIKDSSLLKPEQAKIMNEFADGLLKAKVKIPDIDSE